MAKRDRHPIIRVLLMAGRYDQTPKELADQVEDMIKAHDPHLIIHTEMGNNARARVLEDTIGYGLVHKNGWGRDECAIQYRLGTKGVKIKKLGRTSIPQMTDEKYYTGGGHVRAPAHMLMQRFKINGRRILVTGKHYPNLPGNRRFGKKSPRRKAWFDTHKKSMRVYKSKPISKIDASDFNAWFGEPNPMRRHLDNSFLRANMKRLQRNIRGVCNVYVSLDLNILSVEVLHATNGLDHEPLLVKIQL